MAAANTLAGLANRGNIDPRAYNGLTAVENATQHGAYEANRQDMHRPWPPPDYYPKPPKQPIG
jgi:hypothetical protein